MARELKRLTTNMPVDLVERIDEYADKMSINRSSAINVLCNTALDSQEAINSLNVMMKAYQKEEIFKQKLETTEELKRPFEPLEKK